MVRARARRARPEVLAFWPSADDDGATALLAAERRERAARRLDGVLGAARIVDLLVTLDSRTLAITTASAAARTLLGIAPRAAVGTRSVG